MKIGITGHTGKLGSLLVKGAGFVPLILDVTDRPSISKELDTNPVDIIVNCASVSSIDACEKDYLHAKNVNTMGLANLHREFPSSRILNIGTDQVFDGRSSNRNESSKQNPINSYGFTKLGAEAISNVFGGKTLRLSRTISFRDSDIEGYLNSLWNNQSIYVPSFFYRNYIHRVFAVDAILHFVEHFDSMPSIVNYGGSDNCSMYDLMVLVAKQFQQDCMLVLPRKEDLKNMVFRPHKAGFNISLSRRLGFPMYSIHDTVSRLLVEKESL